MDDEQKKEQAAENQPEEEKTEIESEPAAEKESSVEESEPAAAEESSVEEPEPATAEESSVEEPEPAMEEEGSPEEEPEQKTEETSSKDESSPAEEEVSSEEASESMENEVPSEEEPSPTEDEVPLQEQIETAAEEAPSEAADTEPLKEEKQAKKRARKAKRRTHKKHNWKKILGITFGSILGVLLLIYVGFVIFFQSHFLFSTEINGVDFSMKNVTEVEEYMRQQVEDYQLTLVESDGQIEQIVGTDISAAYVPGDEIQTLLGQQESFLWPKALWETQEIETSVGVSYDETELTTVLAGLNCTQEENWVDSENAYPAFQNSKFVVVPEKIGTKLDTTVFEEVVSTAISGFVSQIDLMQENCYILPEFSSDSPEVLEAAEKMNSYLGAEVTYDFDDEKVIVDASVIADWIKVDHETMKVSFKKKSVRQYVSDLADQYDTAGKSRKFTTADGRKVKVEGGTFGWQIDQEAEYDALLKNIKNADVIEREPEYSRRGVSHGKSDLGTTYAEVDLTNQHMYYTVDGKVALESDVVTGNPNRGNATPQGVYSISYKTRNAVLRGTRHADGTYDYETPVAYWMPFNGGIGFHDATWQSSFGGSRYLTYGSHGCVNMPKGKAAELYDMIEAGTPVVCYH